MMFSSFTTQKGGLNASRLRNIALRSYPNEPNLVSVLDHAAELATLFAGTIFGCASVSGSTEYLGAPEKHFDGRLFAPLGNVHIFDVPLASARFTEFVKIGQTTITPVYTREAKGIRFLLAEDNFLPAFLSDVEFGDNTFRNVTKENWADISCLPGTRFIHEAQLRSYMLDYFLSAMKDKGSTLLEECQCFRDGHATGIVDNFLRVGGLWVPCEAKLNILSERDIFAEASKYMNIDAFVPTRGSRRFETFYPEKSKCCIVIDQSGLYLISSELEFVNCDYGTPIWKREQLGQLEPSRFRELVDQ